MLSPALEPLVNLSKAADTKAFKSWALSEFIITSFHFLLYGLYIPLFHTALLLLQKRRQTRSQQFHKTTLIALFVLATAAVPIGLACDFLKAAEGYYTTTGYGFPREVFRAELILQIFRYVILTIMGLIVDGVLMFRCFILFGLEERKFLVISAVLFCTIIYIGGLISTMWTVALYLERMRSGGNPFAGFKNIPHLVSNGFVGLYAVVNLTLISALAGRIWWLSRINPEDRILKTRLNALIAILLESGIVYLTAGQIVFIIGNLLPKDLSYDSGSIIIQLAGITPTIIFVRANSNKSPEWVALEGQGNGNSNGQTLDYDS